MGVIEKKAEKLEKEIVSIESLLNEYQNEKNNMKGLLGELEELKNDVKSLLPKDGTDFSKRYSLENKLKVIMEYFKLITDLRKQVLNAIEKQVNMKTKSDKGNETDQPMLFKEVVEAIGAISSTKDQVTERKKQEKNPIPSELNDGFGNSFPSIDLPEDSDGDIKI